MVPKSQRRVCFGSWRTDPEGVAAKDRHDWEIDFIRKGQAPPPLLRDGCTIERLCNEFVESKTAAVEDGDLSVRTLADFHQIVRQIAKHFGNGRIVETLTPADFHEFRSALAKRFNTATLKSFVNKVRVVFNKGHEAKLFPMAIDYRPELKRPSAKLEQRHRNEHRPSDFRCRFRVRLDFALRAREVAQKERLVSPKLADAPTVINAAETSVVTLNPARAAISNKTFFIRMSPL